ncbi:MAG: serine/threonine-protein kinase [Myxococcota bacterium]
MTPPTRAPTDAEAVTREEEERFEEGVRARPPSDAEVAPDPEIGQQVGPYTLLELLGQGGAASVFRAKKGPEGVVVALKVLAAEKLSRPRIVQRFYDEAKTASTVPHPALVQFVEMVEVEAPKRLAYAMEYVAGQPLRARLSSGNPIPLGECIHIAKQICAGVSALHQAGIVHRDLKPENIMLVPSAGAWPVVKILDFGVAKFLSQPADHGRLQKPEAPGTFVGTPRYMAPEQAAGGAIDGRSDLFAIGVMLFEMITGQRPHEGETLKAVVMAKLKGAPRLLMNPDREILPQELADVVDACLKLQPDLRPSDARAVIRILDEAQAVLAAVGPVRLDPTAGVVRAGQKGASGPASPAQPLAREDKNNREVVTLARPEGGSPSPLPPASAPLPAEPPLAEEALRLGRPRVRVLPFAIAMLLVALVIAVLAAVVGLRSDAVYVVPAGDPRPTLVPSGAPTDPTHSATAAPAREHRLPQAVSATIPAG